MTALKSWYDQSFRNVMTKPAPMTPRAVQGPASAQTGTTMGASGAGQQASALRRPMQNDDDDAPMWTQLGKQGQDTLRGGYAAGGFEGIVNAAGSDAWYDLPPHVRTQLLVGARR